MSWTVLVELEQLQEIEWIGGICSICRFQRRVGHKPDCWFGNAIKQAEGLGSWEPKVGDWVWLRSTRKVGPWRITMIREDYSFQGAASGEQMFVARILNERGMEEWRYLDELMPAKTK